jgi:hypothetical protein
MCLVEQLLRKPLRCRPGAAARDARAWRVKAHEQAAPGTRCCCLLLLGGLVCCLLQPRGVLRCVWAAASACACGLCWRVCNSRLPAPNWPRRTHAHTSTCTDTHTHTQHQQTHAHTRTHYERAPGLAPPRRRPRMTPRRRHRCQRPCLRLRPAAPPGPGAAACPPPPSHAHLRCVWGCVSACATGARREARGHHTTPRTTQQSRGHTHHQPRGMHALCRLSLWGGGPTPKSHPFAPGMRRRRHPAAPPARRRSQARRRMSQGMSHPQSRHHSTAGADTRGSIEQRQGGGTRGGGDAGVGAHAGRAAAATRTADTAAEQRQHTLLQGWSHSSHLVTLVTRQLQRLQLLLARRGRL